MAASGVIASIAGIAGSGRKQRCVDTHRNEEEANGLPELSVLDAIEHQFDPENSRLSSGTAA